MNPWTHHGLTDIEWQKLATVKDERIRTVCAWIQDGTLDRLPTRLECPDGSEWNVPKESLVNALKVVASGDHGRMVKLKDYFPELLTDVKAWVARAEREVA